MMVEGTIIYSYKYVNIYIYIYMNNIVDNVPPNIEPSRTGFIRVALIVRAKNGLKTTPSVHSAAVPSSGSHA